MNISRPAFRIGVFLGISAMSLLPLSASAQDETREEYCARTAGQYCLNTYGVDSQECQDAYIARCINGFGYRNGGATPAVGEPTTLYRK